VLQSECLKVMCIEQVNTRGFDEPEVPVFDASRVRRRRQSADLGTSGSAVCITPLILTLCSPLIALDFSFSLFVCHSLLFTSLSLCIILIVMIKSKEVKILDSLNVESLRVSLLFTSLLFTHAITHSRAEQEKGADWNLCVSHSHMLSLTRMSCPGQAMAALAALNARRTSAEGVSADGALGKRWFQAPDPLSRAPSQDPLASLPGSPAVDPGIQCFLGIKKIWV
jgi:hypothetical protein